MNLLRKNSLCLFALALMVILIEFMHILTQTLPASFLLSAPAFSDERDRSLPAHTLGIVMVS